MKMVRKAFFMTMNMNLDKLWETVRDGEACVLWSHRVLKESNMTGLLSNNKNILRSVKSIATVERDWAQLQIQQRQLGTYSQKAEWRGSQWTENY